MRSSDWSVLHRRLAPLLVGAALLAACGRPPDAPAPPPPAPAAPEPTTPRTAEPSEARGTRQVTAFFVRDQADRLWVEPAAVVLDEPTRGVARAAMTALLAGAAADPALGTPANPAATVRGVSIAGDLLTVDVSDDIRQPTAGAGAEAAFAQQLAHTAAQFDGVEAVRLWIDGQPITELWGHLDWSQPLRPDLFALSPVVISSPAPGATVPTGTLRVTGEANTFEANVPLRLIAPDGRVAASTFTTATCGTGCRGTWSHTFRLAAPGRWTIEASEDDPSGGQGRPPFVARVQVQAAAG